VKHKYTNPIRPRKISQRTDSHTTTDELTEMSEQAIQFIVFQTLTDPDNEEKISVLQQPKRGLWLVISPD
jgi:hypothetical protein